MPRKSRKAVDGEIDAVAQDLIRKAKKGPTFKDGLQNIHTIETIAIADINLEDRRFQHRVADRVSDLIPSLTADGQLVPIILWNNQPPYIVVDGYRRTGAIASLGWPTVRAIVLRDIPEEEAFRLSFIENVKRKNYSPMDMAHAIWKMENRGKSTEDLTTDFGLSKRQIQRYRALLEFPEPLKNALADGTITMAQAKIFHDFGVTDLTPWLESLAKGISAPAMKRQLKKRVGVFIRPKNYFRREEDGFRLFPIKLSSKSSEADRKRVIEVLAQALEIAKQLNQPPQP